ncbi:10392_t:CDS:2 [Paraglomus brasilianum]|uniref:10392_t:CDS:1 n=1 Tax=Paraglomus brasilianum TaxID=144538 RepID=A0A9N9GHI6_9GLOM|nr:10392_t:CDS:2 [Paraglomus brasilianum]
MKRFWSTLVYRDGLSRREPKLPASAPESTRNSMISLNDNKKYTRILNGLLGKGDILKKEDSCEENKTDTEDKNKGPEKKIKKRRVNSVLFRGRGHRQDIYYTPILKELTKLNNLITELFTGRLYTVDLALFFESILLIIERNEFKGIEASEPITPKDEEPITRIPVDFISEYNKTLLLLVQKVFRSLSDMGVLTNWISFSARVLAFCFLRLPEVAYALIKDLPVKEFHTKRLLAIIEPNEKIKSESLAKSYDMMQNMFPKNMHPFCYKTSRIWWNQLRNPKKEWRSADIEMSGNCKKRWLADDSDLFFSFYKHYHIALKSYFADSSDESSTSPFVYIASPGYLHFAGFFLQKLDLLIYNREVYAITGYNLNSNGTWQIHTPKTNACDMAKKAYNMGRTITMGEFVSLNKKPLALEAASSRFAETIATVVEQGIYEQMPNIWLKAVVKKTNMYDWEGVFCLFDFMENLIDSIDERVTIALSPPTTTTTKPNLCSTSTLPSIVDIPFIISFISVILKECDHASSLLRTISFIYSQFTLLTASPEYLQLLVLDTLMIREVFDKLFCHWAKFVRAYFIRLLVWRVKRIHCRVTGCEDDCEDEVSKEVRKIRKLYTRRIERINSTHELVTAYKAHKVEEQQALSLHQSSASIYSIPSSATSVSSLLSLSSTQDLTSAAFAQIEPSSSCNQEAFKLSASIEWHLALQRDTYAEHALSELDKTRKEYRLWKQAKESNAGMRKHVPGLVVSFPRNKEND